MLSDIEKYLPALQASQAEFSHKDPEIVADFSGTTFDPVTRTISVTYLGLSYEVEHPSGEIIPTSHSDQIHITRKILILHYLNTASGEPVRNRWVAYRELEGGADYFSVFNRDALRPMVNFFGDKPDLFGKVMELRGAIPVKMGDAGYQLTTFPRVPLALAMWYADDEFPANGQILFDASATSYLPIYDLKIVALELVHSLIYQARSL